MNKLFPFILLILMSLSGFSQEYKCVNPNTTSFFSDGTEQNAIRPDSVTNGWGCQVFWNYPVIRPASQNDFCFSDHGGSWIGRKFSVFPNGDYIFNNLEGTPILIKTNAVLNESWVCYERDDLKVKATLSGWAPETFIGLTDSVKTISLQALDSNGTPISHSINNKQFKISKSYGFVKVIPFYVFPDIEPYLIPDLPNQFTLTGLSNPQTGSQNLTAHDCYNYNIGDELHTLYTLEDMYYQKSKKSIKKLIAQTFSQNLDTLYLEWQSCSRETWTAGGSDTIFYFDGVYTEQVNFSQIENSINKLPGEIISLDGTVTDNYNRGFTQMFGKPCKSLYLGFYRIPDDTCLSVIIVKGSPKTTNMGYLDKTYVEGLGGDYYTRYDFAFESYGLVYWKKGIEEWGTPYTCSDLLNVAEIEKNPVLSIFPNPFNNQLNLTLASGYINNLKIFDVSGRLVLDRQLNQKHISLSVENLQPGLYFILINNQLRSKIMKGKAN